ncbi:tRNA uridine-5-carboxymethylaminomethyl(34) synthesis GTPase MnmE [Altererythrobacter fulvus]|uniref:tRNA uridine-5-carboxymethylaminomethyl(34) synthesis GTPase MnmE n=1 Tax=Caenibius fulvus TaxID=2126012 RepID=UPI00301AC672
MDTIFALSSGQPPAGVAVLRISGPRAAEALRELAGSLPEARHASLRTLHNGSGDVLDRALVLWFPGPNTATGEDLAELHLHGGRAVIAAVEAALANLSGLRRAAPGEFTRRAFANGRIDLAEAEGLADLLAAETELQRRVALDMAEGVFSRQVADWRDRILICSAQIEAVLDFADEDDVASLPSEFTAEILGLANGIREALDAPHAETLREGFRVVLAGPPNAGKSTLFNALVESEAAITSPSAGTTRDVLVRPVALGGVPFSFIDTAGLRDEGAGEIEAIGIARAQAELERADLVLWLGSEGQGPQGAWDVEAQIDLPHHDAKSAPSHRVSAVSGEGIASLKQDLIVLAQDAMPRPGQAALSARQRGLLRDAVAALEGAVSQSDPLLIAEQLRLGRVAFDRLIGRAATEDMLDALFGRFCIGK